MARETCDAVNGAGAYDETLDIHQDAVWKPIATAAIDLIRAEVLEEAARVAETCEWWTHELKDSDERGPIAAAIRALKDKQHD